MDDTDGEGSEDDDSDENGMVLDGRDDQFSNQEIAYDRESEDGEDSLNMHDLDNTQNDSEMMVITFLANETDFLIMVECLGKVIS